MTERRLLAALIAAALLMPGVASAAADDEMLRAFGDAARTLPPAAVVKPQPRPKPAVKATVQPDQQAEVKRLRARIEELEKAASAVPAANPDESLKRQLAAAQTAQQRSEAALKALQAEREKQVAAAQAESARTRKAQQTESQKQLAEQQAASDRQIKALTAEKQQQTQQIAELTQALKNAQQQQSAGSAQLTKQLAAAQTAQQRSEAALQALQVERDKQLAALQAENQKQLTAQQAESDKKFAALQAENQKQLTAQQAENDKKLAARQSEAQQKLAAQRAESDKQLAALQAQQSDSSKQLSVLNDEKQQQATTIASLTADLAAAKKAPAAAAEPAEPKSDAERDGYTLGQFIASNAVVQLQMVKDIGLTISMDQLIAGLTAQLKTGNSVLAGEEMARRYATMQESISKGLNALIEKGYAQLDKQVAKRKVLQADHGMRWFAVKPVKAKLTPEQQVAVTVKVSTLSGKVINDFRDDQVPFNDSLPPLLHEGMALTGKGGAVEGWALAKDIYEREPLPPWVAPYDVIHYALTVK